PAARSSTFFLSSRRRHTRFSRDWSSDVCSSDLGRRGHSVAIVLPQPRPVSRLVLSANLYLLLGGLAFFLNQWWFLQLYDALRERSEERRVGKEGRSWGMAWHHRATGGDYSARER